MSVLDHILKQAAGRMTLNRALRLGGLGLLIGAGVSIIALLIDRLGVIALPWWVFAGLCAAGLCSGVAIAMSRRPDSLAVATFLDHELRLRDRLGSAVAVQRGLVQTPHEAQQAFAAWTVHDAQQYASRVSVRSAVPIRMTSIWNVSLVLSIVLTLGVLLLPRATWGDSPEQIAHNTQQLQQLEARRDALRQSIQSTVDELESDAVDDPRVAEQLDALRELEQQLASEPPQPKALDQSRDESAARFHEVAERLEEQAKRDRLATDKLVDEFEKLVPADAPPTTKELIEQLREGNLNNVADELQRLLDESQQLDEPTRQAAAESLRSASDALDSQPQDQEEDDSRRKQLEQVLREQGLDEQTIDDLTNPPDAPTQRDITDDLAAQGVDESAARTLAEELNDLDRQRDAAQRAEQDRETVRDALKDAADTLDPPVEQPGDPLQMENAPQQSANQPAATDADQQQQPQSNPQQPANESNAGDSQQQPAAQPDGAQQEQSESQTGKQRQTQGNPQQPGQHEQSVPDESDPQNAEKSDTPSTKEQPDGAADQAAQGEQNGESKTEPAPDKQQSPQQQPDSSAAESKETEGTQDRRPEKSDDAEENAAPNPGQQDQPGEQLQSDQHTQSGDTETSPAKPSDDPNAPPAAREQKDPRKNQEGADARQDDASQTPPKQQQPAERGGSQPGSEQQPQQDQRDMSPAEKIRELQKRKDLAERLRNLSDETKQRAREMAEQMSDEEKQRWAREMQRQLGDEQLEELLSEENLNSGGDDPDKQNNTGGTTSGNGPPDDAPQQKTKPFAPLDTEPVDARGENTNADQILSEWLSDTAGPVKPGATGSTGEVAPVRRAQDFARRAVNETAVPRRYHQLIDRYFGRLSRTVEQATNADSSDSLSENP